MAILSRIKFDGLLNGKDWLIYRYPGDSFVAGTQLIVGEGQVAVFVKGGQALDYFTAGSYTLSTSNIPLLQKIIKLPFGKNTPYTAEIYFINKTFKLDVNWGTIDPIQLIDPKYHIKLRIRAFGQFGVKVDDFRVFLTELIGSLSAKEIVSYDMISNYFKGILVMKVKSLIAKAIIENKVSALEIIASIDEISNFCMDAIKDEFFRFGLKVVNFYIQSINFPDEDFEEINKILRDKAAFDIIGDQRYVTKRSFDTLESAAKNESGVAGTMVGAGLGLGVGVGVGGAVVDVAKNINTNPKQVASKTCSHCGHEVLDNTSFCGNCATKVQQASPQCTKCGENLIESAKFCVACGTSVIQSRKCKNCDSDNDIKGKFCKDCGHSLEGDL